MPTAVSPTSMCLPPPPRPPGIHLDLFKVLRDVRMRFEGGSSSKPAASSSSSESAMRATILGAGCRSALRDCRLLSGAMAERVATAKDVKTRQSHCRCSEAI